MAAKSKTTIRKVVVGTPIRRVTSGAFSLTNLTGVTLSGKTDSSGDILVYNTDTSTFVRTAPTEGNGIDIQFDASNRKLTISGEVASTTNAGISSFDSSAFNVDLSGAVSFKFTSIPEALVPDSDNYRDLGSTDKRWRTLYISGQTIDLGGTQLSVDDSSSLTFDGSKVFTAGDSSITTDSLTEGVTNLFFTNARVRSALQAAGDLTYDSSTGTFSIDVETVYTKENFDSDFALLNTDNLSEGSTNLYHTTARARSAISAKNLIRYNSSTGVIRGDSDQVKALFSVTDNGGDGSLSYSNGVITYTGPSASEVRAHLVAGTGVTYDSAAGRISIGQDVGTTSNVQFGNATLSGYLAGPATFVIDPAAVGDATGTVRILGNLTVEGTTTEVNSTTIVLNDKNLVLADSAADSASLNGGGITIGGSNIVNPPSMTYVHVDSSIAFNRNITSNKFTGTVVGNVTGNVTGTVSSLANFNTNSLVEGNNLYYTTVRADSDFDVRLATKSTTNVAEGNNLYYTTVRADSDAKNAVSAVDAGGDGSFTYNSETGVFTYTGPSASETRAHLVASTGISYDSALGKVSITNTGVSASTYGSSTLIPQLTINEQGQVTSASTVQVAGVDSASWDSDTNTYRITLATGSNLDTVIGGFNNIGFKSLSDSATSVVRSKFSVTDAGGDGSLSYSNGVFTYTGPSASEVRAHLVAGTGVTYDSAAGRISIGQAVGTGDSVTFGGLYVAGDFAVSGTTTTINTQTLNVADNIITLNDGTTGSPTENAGIEVDRGSAVNKSIQWNETADQWYIESDGTGTLKAGSFIGNVTGTVSSIANHSTTNLSEGNNLYYTSARADSDARSALVAVDAGGDGSFSYDSATGKFTYTGPSAAEARAHFSADQKVIRYNSSTGVFNVDSSAIRSIFSASGTLAYDSATGQFTASGIDSASIRNIFSAGGDLSYDSATGQFSFTQRTDAQVRGLVSVTDAGGDGSLSYDSGTGVFTYTGPSATEVRAHLVAGTGVTYDSAAGRISIGQPVGTGDSATFSGLRILNDVTVGSQLTSPSAVITAIEGTTFDLTGTSNANKPAYSESKMWYDTDAKTYAFHTADSDYVQYIGEKEWVRGRNSSGTTITKGTPVYTSGVHIPGHPIHGHHPLIYPADASDAAKYEVIGITAHDIPNGAHGYVLTRGWLQYINTASLTSGERFHLAPGGGIQKDAPTYPNYPVDLGIALTVDSAGGGGSVYIDINSHTQEQLRVTGNGRFDGNMFVGGNLNVVGTTTQAQTTSITVSSNLVKLLDGNTLGTTYNTPGGLNDITFTGSYRGDSDLYYFVKITATDSATVGDTIQWGISDSATMGYGSFNGTYGYGNSFDSASSGITSWNFVTNGKTAPLRNNISAQTVSVSGHTLNDVWCSHPVELNLDLGIVGNYNPSGPGGIKYAGIYRDVGDGRWRFFDGLTQNLDSNQVTISSGDGFTLSDIQFATAHGSLTGNVTGQVSDLSNQYSTIRGLVSVTDAGGDGSLSYDNGTGVITYTGPSATEVRSHLIGVDAGGDGSFAYDSATGKFTYTGPSASEVRAHFSGGTGVTITDGSVAIGQAVGTGDAVTFGGLTVNGNIIVSGTVDGRDVATDGTKLDGIESGATADQSAAEILSALLTVDGAGTLLDADKLDGQEGSYYRINVYDASGSLLN